MKGEMLEQKIFKLIYQFAVLSNASHSCAKHGDRDACGDLSEFRKEVEKRRKDLAFTLAEVI